MRCGEVCASNFMMTSFCVLFVHVPQDNNTMEHWIEAAIFNFNMGEIFAVERTRYRCNGLGMEGGFDSSRAKSVRSSDLSHDRLKKPSISWTQ